MSWSQFNAGPANWNWSDPVPLPGSGQSRSYLDMDMCSGFPNVQVVLIAGGPAGQVFNAYQLSDGTWQWYAGKNGVGLP